MSISNKDSVITEKHPTRNSAFELLRIVSMILIVAYHAGRNIDVSQLSMINRGMYYLISSWGLLGVDLFVIISAWFLCEQKFRTTKLVSLVFEVVTYVFVFTILSAVWNTYKTGGALAIVLKHHINEFLSPFWANEYWFITAYVFMLILTPFINKLYELFDRKSLKSLLILFSFIPVYSTFGGRGVVNDVMNFCYIYFLVLYLKRIDFCLKRKLLKILPYIFIGVIIVGKVVFFAISNNMSSVDNVSISNIFLFFDGFINNTILDTNRHSLILLIISFFIFFSIKDVKPFYSNFINLVSSCTLGVYLFHENSLFNLCDILKGVGFKIGFIQYDNLFPLTYLTVIFCVYILGSMLEFFRIQILQKPFNKFLNENKNRLLKIDDFINLKHERMN
ncbi:MAG: acyltransferase [Fibrobacter sp.]|nr:acyltransferase [Fibrobacter sp.]